MLQEIKLGKGTVGTVRARAARGTRAGSALPASVATSRAASTSTAASGRRAAVYSGQKKTKLAYVDTVAKPPRGSRSE